MAAKNRCYSALDAPPFMCAPACAAAGGEGGIFCRMIIVRNALFLLWQRLLLLEEAGSRMKIDGLGSITPGNSTSKKRGISASGQFADLLAAAEAGESSSTLQTADIAAA